MEGMGEVLLREVLGVLLRVLLRVSGIVDEEGSGGGGLDGKGGGGALWVDEIGVGTFQLSVLVAAGVSTVSTGAL